MYVCVCVAVFLGVQQMRGVEVSTRSHGFDVSGSYDNWYFVYTTCVCVCCAGVGAILFILLVQYQVHFLRALFQWNLAIFFRQLLRET